MAACPLYTELQQAYKVSVTEWIDKNLSVEFDFLALDEGQLDIFTNKAVLELILRRLLRYYVYNEENIMKARLLIDFTLLLQKANLLDAMVPLSLLEELFDYLPVKQVPSLFDQYVLNRQHILLEGMVPNKGKGLIILRICNALLRRVPKTAQALFCGSILIFLSHIFPLTERSAVNMKGNVNTDHKIIIDDPQDENDIKIDMKNIASVETAYNIKEILDDIKSNLDQNIRRPISYGFYQCFWTFQEYLKNPLAMVTKSTLPLVDGEAEKEMEGSQSTSFLPEGQQHSNIDSTLVISRWPIFQKLSQDMITLIEGLACIFTVTGSSINDTSSELSSNVANSTATRYLTSRQLLKSQLRDRFFQLRILYQISFSLSTVKGVLKNQSLGSENLFEEQQKFCVSQLSRCLSVLDKYEMNSDRNGLPKCLHTNTLLEALNRLLRHEEDIWIAWKSAGCPMYDHTQLEASNIPIHLPDHIIFDTSILEEHTPESAPPAPSFEERFASLQGRVSIPKLSDLLLPLKEQLDPDAGIDPEYRVDKLPTYRWLVRRLLLSDYELARSFVASNNNLESLILKVFK